MSVIMGAIKGGAKGSAEREDTKTKMEENAGRSGGMGGWRLIVSSFPLAFVPLSKVGVSSTKIRKFRLWKRLRVVPEL